MEYHVISFISYRHQT